MKKKIEKYFDRLWPLCRSITGNGLRESLKILNEIIPLQIHEVPSGIKVFDWTVPNEWNIKDAYILTPTGKKIADFKSNNLHIVNYSKPFKGKIQFKDLESRLYFLKDQPNAIPYITSYYKEDWGFCITYNDFKRLPKDGEYEVIIDSSLEPGSLTYGESYLPGKTKKEILFSTYVCHPSMANNELSGPLVTAFLYKYLKENFPNRKYSYRFVFAPETIGIISFLNKSGQELLKNLHAGYVITCIGDDGMFTYKCSKRGNSIADIAAQHILNYKNIPHKIIDYAIGGSDERQYCSPGFNLPVGSLMRTMYKEYQEYHTSLDNKDLISFNAMEESIKVYFEIIKLLELNKKYKGTIQFCEPQLSKRGLYPSSMAWKKRTNDRLNILHLLSYADGKTDLIEIANRKGICALEFSDIIPLLIEKGLLIH